MHRRFPELTATELEEIRRISAAYRPHSGYDRIYNIHVRKTGGTSVNHMFYALAGCRAAEVDRRLHDAEKRVAVYGNKVYAWGNEQVINSGHYFYAASHIPAHALRLPPRTFTVTTLRDPLDRVISHYRMVLANSRNGAGREFRQQEESWLGSGTFREFIERMPREKLCGQLHMFSARLDIQEAVDTVLHCSHWFFVHEFDTGAATLRQKTGLAIEPVHVRKGELDCIITADDRKRATAMLSQEFRLIELLERTQ